MWYSPTSRHFTIKVYNIRHTMKFLVSDDLTLDQVLFEDEQRGMPILRNMVSAVHYSIGFNVQLLQIQTYCHKANHTTHITLHTVI